MYIYIYTHTYTERDIYHNTPGVSVGLQVGNVARFINHRCSDNNLKVVRMGASWNYK